MSHNLHILDISLENTSCMYHFVSSDWVSMLVLEAVVEGGLVVHAYQQNLELAAAYVTPSGSRV